MRESLPELLRFRRLKHRLSRETVDSLAASNPQNWETYALIGRYRESCGEREQAREWFRRALARPIPEGERITLENKLKE